MNDASFRPRPRGLQRLMLRAPLILYRLSLGWLLGRRFLLLEHIGRKSGRRRQTVLEVAGFDPATGAYTVAAGFGPRSDWYRNLRANPEAWIQVGRRRLAVTADLLDGPASGEAMVDYFRRHPRAARALLRLLTGRSLNDDVDAYRQVAEQLIPFVRFQPRG